MGEIIHVQLGKCGNIIGKKFLNTIKDEHKLNTVGCYEGQNPNLHLQRINLYFRELETQPNRVRYVPRAIVVDFDPIDLDITLSHCFQQFIDEKNVVCEEKSAYNNWATGYYRAKHNKVIDKILNIVRKEAETCESMQGIQIVHSLGGGTGGGLSSLLAKHMSGEYSNKILQSYSVLPATKSFRIRDVYNSVLTLTYLDDYIHEIFCMDQLTVKRIHEENTGKRNMYDWISSFMSGITSCLRFPCSLNINLRKLLENMEPYPRLHFFVPGYVEIFLRSRFKVFSMTQRLFDNKNIFLDCNLAQEYFFTATAIFRGQISPMHFEEEMRNMRVKYKNNFVEWIPHNTQTTVCSVPPSREKWSLTSVLNTTAIQQPFQTLLNFFRKQVHYKNYLHWYTQEGMEISQFENAQNKLDRLLCEYKEKQRTGNKN